MSTVVDVLFVKVSCQHVLICQGLLALLVKVSYTSPSNHGSLQDN